MTTPNVQTAARNGLGTTALVLGILGLLFSFIPFIGVIAWPLVILGLIFGILGFVRSRSGKATNGGMAIAGAVLSLIGLVICIVYASAFSAAVSDLPGAATGTPANAGAGDVVVYEITGSGKAGNITYTKQGGQEQVSGVDLPFRKEVRFDGGLFNPLTLVAQNGGSGDITCTISKNGQPVTSSTSSGQFAVVTCNGT